MKARNLAAAALAGTLIAGASAQAQTAAVRETVTPQFSRAIPNVPGRTMTTVVVDYPPGAKSLPHHHGKTTFVYAYVLSGAVLNQVNDEAPKTYRTGEHWIEMPGAHHKTSENASATEPAKVLVVYVAFTGEKVMTFDTP